MLKSASLVGVNYGAWHKREPAMNRALHAKLLDWIAAGNLVIQIDSEFPLAQVGDALQHLASRRSQGKVLIAIES
jgi:NADPH2:quinone reductase